MNGYIGIDRRQSVNNGIRRLTDKVNDIRYEVKRINGRVKEVEGKVGDIEKTDVFDDGFKKGKKSMKTSTRNLLIIAQMVLACLLSGIAIFTSGQKSLEKVIKTALLDINKK